MNNERTALSILLVVAALTSGCQTATRPIADQAVTPPESVTPAPAPIAAPPAATPQPGAEPKAGEAVAAPAVRSMSITEMQQRLTELGYKPGTADGKTGPRTTNALKRFQHDRKLPVTGTLDAETIIELHKP